MTPTTVLVLVAALFAAGQFLITDMSRFFAWDEAVYVSQASPFIPNMGPGPHRAPGTPWIVTPVLLVTDSISVLRSYLALLSSCALFGSFAVWKRSIGWASPIAAALFGSSWLAMGYGSEVMPNLWSAFSIVATTGLALLAVRRPARRWHVGVAVGEALTIIIRPLDGAVLFLVVVLIAIFAGSRRQPFQLALWAVAGATIGVLPWIIEAFLRFESPMNRLAQTRELVGSGLTRHLSDYVQLLRAPLESGSFAATTAVVVVWLGTLVFLNLLCISVGRWSLEGRVAVLAGGSSLILAAPYLFYTEVTAPRFLTPALAMLSIGAAMGLITIVAKRPRTYLLGWVVLSVSLVTLMAIQVFTLHWWSAFQTDIRGSFSTLASVLYEASDGEPCAFLSTYGYPQLAVGSRCVGYGLSDDPKRNEEFLTRHVAEGRATFALVTQPNPEPLLGTSWVCEAIDPSIRWQLCRRVT